MTAMKGEQERRAMEQQVRETEHMALQLAKQSEQRYVTPGLLVVLFTKHLASLTVVILCVCFVQNYIMTI